MIGFILLILNIVLIYLLFKRRTKVPFSYNKKNLKNLEKKTKIISFLEKSLSITTIIIAFLFIINNFSPFFFTYTVKKEVVEAKNINIILDISKSMFGIPTNLDEWDTIKDNKIEKVQKQLLETLKLFEWNKVWFLTFSGKTIINNFPTFNIKKVAESIKNIETGESVLESNLYDDVSFNGTAIGDALVLWWTFLNNERENIILLITDWENNLGLSPLQAISFLKERNTKVYIFWLTEKNNFRIEELQKLANATWGEFINVKKTEELKSFVNKILENENQKIVISENLSLHSKIMISLIIIFICNILFLIYHFIKDKDYRSLYPFIPIFLISLFIATTFNNKENTIDNIDNIIEKENKGNLNFIIDFSKSMDAIDKNESVSRIEHTRFFLKNLTKKIKNNPAFSNKKIGIYVFNDQIWEILSPNDVDIIIERYIKNLTLNNSEAIETDYSKLYSIIKESGKNSDYILITDWSFYSLENDKINQNFKIPLDNYIKKFQKKLNIKDILKKESSRILWIIIIWKEYYVSIPLWNNSFKTINGKKVYTWLNPYEVEYLKENISKNIYNYYTDDNIDEKLLKELYKNEGNNSFEISLLFLQLLLCLCVFKRWRI